MFTKDALIRGARVALWTFIATFSVSLLGFISDVSKWAGSADGHFPSVNPLGKAAVAAMCAALSGFIGLVVNTIEDKRKSKGVFGAKAEPRVEPAAGGGYPEPPTVHNSVVGSTDQIVEELTVEELQEIFDKQTRRILDGVRRALRSGLESKATAKKKQ